MTYLQKLADAAYGFAHADAGWPPEKPLPLLAAASPGAREFYERLVLAIMTALFGPDNVAWLDQEGANDLPVGPGFWGYPADRTAFLGDPQGLPAGYFLDPAGESQAHPQSFRDDLEHVINRHSMENGSNTPDFILADYLASCLRTWDIAVSAREGWYGRRPTPIENGDYEHEPPPGPGAPPAPPAPRFG